MWYLSANIDWSSPDGILFMSNHYKLLTPGPLSTSETVKQAMLKDWCTWDEDYNLGVVQEIRGRLVSLATASQGYTSVLMQGSGTASVEAALGTFVAKKDKLLVINNGAYGARIAQICEYLNIAHDVLSYSETQEPIVEDVRKSLLADPQISHVAMVHCETTTGMLNPVEAVAKEVKSAGKVFILDAMSSFGGLPMDIEGLGVDVMISSANKCIQGVPGFGFVIAKTELLKGCEGVSRSLSLDLYDQWQAMEKGQGKWRYTSPTHVVRAFHQALIELGDEGGVAARYQRYQTNQRKLVQGMRLLGFETLLADDLHSPIITSFLSPKEPGYDFKTFYQKLKARGFVIYPGKVSDADCFRVGNIGEIYPEDIDGLLAAVAEVIYW